MNNKKRGDNNIGGGLMFDRQFANNGYQGNFNLGSNQGLWYFQVSGSYLERDFYTLSDAFKAVPTQGPGRRNNSDNRDKKINVKIGLTPNATDEYSLNYINQQGSKGKGRRKGASTCTGRPPCATSPISAKKARCASSTSI